jgi:hypothetical protein
MNEVKTSDARCQSFYALLGWRTVLSSCESARILGSRLCHSFSLSCELFVRSHGLDNKNCECRRVMAVAAHALSLPSS